MRQIEVCGQVLMRASCIQPALRDVSQAPVTACRQAVSEAGFWGLTEHRDWQGAEILLGIFAMCYLEMVHMPSFADFELGHDLCRDSSL